MSTELELRELLIDCAQELADRNGGDTVLLDLRPLSSWTDFFIVTGATSSTHMRGLLKHADEFLGPRGYAPIRRPSPADDEEWCLVDYGPFVLHIMSAGAREFYELEKLWFEAEKTAFTPRTGADRA